jgi:recombination protein RecA
MSPLAALPQSIRRHLCDLSLKEQFTGNCLSSGLPAFDLLTHGGFARGSLNEIFGPASSGATTLAASLLSHASTNGEFCALVDASDAFCPASGAAAGIKLEQLLWVRCGGNAESAIKTTDLLIQGGGFGVILVDLIGIAPDAIRRFPLSWWYRFRRAVEGTPAVLVMMAREVYVKPCTSMAVEMRPARPRWTGDSADFRILRGSSFEAGVRKPVRTETSRWEARVPLAAG